MRQGMKWAMPGIALIVALVGGGANATADETSGPVSYKHLPEVDRADAAPVGARTSAAPPARAVISRTGTLTSRPAGLPSSTEPARQFESATVEQDLDRGTIGGRFVLRGVPTAATSASIVLEFGRNDGTTCRGEGSIVAGTLPGSSPVSVYDGRTITIEASRPAASSAEWNCAFAVLVEPATQIPYDALIGELTDVLAPPVPALELKLKDEISVKPGRWAKVRLAVSNPGTGTARDVRLKLKAKRLRVRAIKGKLGNIGSGKRKFRTVKVKLTSKRPGRLVVRAAGRQVRAKAALRVSPRVKVESSSIDGKYESVSAGDAVYFQITRNRYITGFRIYLQVHCGIFPDIPTTTFGWYDFPRVKIPANGKVKAKDKGGDLYSVALEATVTGNRVKDGYFSYNGPNYCFGTERWTAKKVS